MLRIWIPVKFPGRNEQEAASRTHYQRAAEMKKTYTNLARHYCHRALSRNGYHHGWDKRLLRNVRLVFSEPNRRRDKDNISGAMKFIFDGMVAAGIIADDGWRHVNNIQLEFRVAEPDEEPGVLVEVWKATV